LADADHLYAADSHWWKYHIADVARDFEGKCWSCEPSGDTNWKTKNDVPDPAAWGIEILRHALEPGLSRDKTLVHGGGNSGYQAINLAYHLGARCIILLGFDMQSHSGKTHWFGDHPKIFKADTNYSRFLDAFRTIQPDQYGLQIINCSRKTALQAFTVCNLDELL